MNTTQGSCGNTTFNEDSLNSYENEEDKETLSEVQRLLKIARELLHRRFDVKDESKLQSNIRIAIGNLDSTIRVIGKAENEAER